MMKLFPSELFDQMVGFLFVNLNRMQIPPVTVKVANSYSATVKPALLWAVIRTLYHEAGSKSSTTKLPPGFTLFEIWFHSMWSLQNRTVKQNENWSFESDRRQIAVLSKWFELNACKFQYTFSCVRRQNVTYGNCHPSTSVDAEWRNSMMVQWIWNFLALLASIPWSVYSKCLTLRQHQCCLKIFIF